MQTTRRAHPVLTIIVFITLSVLTGCESMVIAEFEENWQNYIGGTYPGQIMSSGVEVSARTFIDYTEEGSLTGRYEMYELDGTVNGTLYDFQVMSFLKLRCRWKDKFGKGVLYITFSDDLLSFSGFWAKAGGKKTFGWSGARVESWQ